MKSKYLTSFILGALLFGGISTAWAGGAFPVATGGTGQITLPAGQLIYGDGTAPVGSVATTSATCGGNSSCTAFTVIGSTPVLITSTGSVSNTFSFASNYAVINAATTSPIWAQSGVNASSTSNFDVLNVGSSTVSSIATSTFFGNLVVKGTASTTFLIISGKPNCLGSSALNTTAAGTISCGTVTQAYAFNPVSAYGTTTSATTSVMWGQQGIFASSTSHFVNADFSGATSTGTFAVTGSTTLASLLNVGGALNAFTTLGVGSSTPFSTLSVGTGAASSSITVAEYKYGKPGNVATSTAANIDCNATNQVAWPIGVSASTLTLINLTPGKVCRVIIQNPNAAAGAITWAVPSGFILKWAGGTQPSQTTGANLVDAWNFMTTAGSSTNEVLGAASLNY